MEVIIMPDGAREVIGGPRDMLDLMDRYMGEDAAKWWREYLHANYMDDNERAKVENDTVSYTERVEEKYQNILRDLNELSQDLEKEIRKPKLDRYKISTIAGKIGTETWRHL